jgi:hypothetical protein
MMEVEDDTTTTRIGWRRQRIVICGIAMFKGEIKDDVYWCEVLREGQLWRCQGGDESRGSR